MAADEKLVTLTLTLRKCDADKLRAICHALDMRASLLVGRWIFYSNEKGEVQPAPKSPAQQKLEDMFKDVLDGRRR